METADKWRPNPLDVSFLDFYQNQHNLKTKRGAIFSIVSTVRKLGEVKDDKQLVQLARGLLLRPVAGKAIDLKKVSAEQLQSQIAELQAQLDMLDE